MRGVHLKPKNLQNAPKVRLNQAILPILHNGEGLIALRNGGFQYGADTRYHH